MLLTLARECLRLEHISYLASYSKQYIVHIRMMISRGITQQLTKVYVVYRCPALYPALLLSIALKASVSRSNPPFEHWSKIRTVTLCCVEGFVTLKHFPHKEAPMGPPAWPQKAVHLYWLRHCRD